jgi:WD40 repeat protein
MPRLAGPLAAAALLALATFALAVPLGADPPPAISPANAERVRAVGELPRDAWEVVWGPVPGQLSLVSWEKPVQVLDAATFRPARALAAGLRVVHFAVAPGGNTVAWCENTTRVEVHDLRADKAVVVETKNSQPAMAFSPDGKLLATGGYGTDAKLWDAASGKLVRSFDAGAQGGLTAAFSPDGRLLAVGNRNDGTRLYEAATGKLSHALPRKMSHELKFSPDGRFLAVAYVDGTVALWDVGRGKLLHSRPAGVREVYTLDWSPKGDVLATAGLGGKITLWEPGGLTALKELEAPEWVIRVRFSPDGTRLLSAGGTATPSPERKVTIWAVSRRR